MSKSFENHQDTAIERQKIAEASLHNVFNISYFSEYESEEHQENIDIDTLGIDAEIGTDEGTKFVAIKTRSNYKRNLDQVDIGLRVAGRNRKPSKEWERFVSEDELVPDVLVFITLNKVTDEVAEILVIDFKELKEMYLLGMSKTRLMYDFGEVKFRDGVVDTEIHNASYPGDDGIFAFLDLDAIRGTSCVDYHMRK